MFIVIEISSLDECFLDSLYEQKDIDFKTARTKKFDGTPDLLEAIVNLTYLSVPLVAKIIIDLIKSRKHVKVKRKGVEITGISEQTALHVLEQLMSEHADEKGNKHK